jgi:hypothetical protein
MIYSESRATNREAVGNLVDMSRTTNDRSAATAGKQRPGANGRWYITREQVAAARKRLDQVDRRLGIVDARLESAQRIKF